MASKNQILTVEGQSISIKQINDTDYISLTDISKNFEVGVSAIESWMRNRNTVEFLGTWEKLYNPDFNSGGFDGIKSKVGLNSFKLSVKKWISDTQAIGLQAKAGRYGGTYGHKDIAIQFCYWLSPVFQLYLIKEFQRLKEEEGRRNKVEWNYSRFLSKVNYRLHTETIRDHILPRLQIPKNREWIAYAEEADLLNMAVFGQTAQQWREANPEAAQKGNMRDFASIEELNVLANLEGLNSYLIRKGAGKEGRYIALAEEAINQYKRLASYEGIQYLGE